MCCGNLQVRLAIGYLYVWGVHVREGILPLKACGSLLLARPLVELAAPAVPATGEKSQTNSEILWLLIQILASAGIWITHLSETCMFLLVYTIDVFFHSWIMTNKSDFLWKTPSLRLRWEGPAIPGKVVNQTNYVSPGFPDLFSSCLTISASLSFLATGPNPRLSPGILLKKSIHELIPVRYSQDTQLLRRVLV